MADSRRRWSIECSEEELATKKYDQIQPEFDERDLTCVNEFSAEMFNLPLNIATGETNSVVCRSLGSGWLAWKRLTSSLDSRTLASGVKPISAGLAPPSVSQANKADQALDEWEDRLVKLGTEYGQEVKACAMNWDEATESEAGRVVHEDQGPVAEHRQGKARDGRSEADGSGSSCKSKRVTQRLVRRAQPPGRD